MLKNYILTILALASCSCNGAMEDRAGQDEKVEAEQLATQAEKAAHDDSIRAAVRTYDLPGTQVLDVADPASGRTYQVFVSLPAGYETNKERRYPVLYVTDADYAFPIVRQISRRLNVGSKRIQDHILVGLSYAVGEDSMSSRRRDYTPSPAGAHDAPPGSAHGESRLYAGYLRETVFPFIAGKYRTDEGRRLFLGHSYGGLLGLDILFSAPGTFSGYVIGSPSIWYDGNMAEDLEREFASRNQDLNADIYMYVGEYEDMRPGDSRYAKRYNMVSDAKRMQQILASRSYPSLRFRLDVLNDEDHLTVAPRGFTKGLQYLLANEMD